MRLPRTILFLSVLMAVAVATAQESVESVPLVVQHDEPIYPPLARQAHIQGEVSLRITTDGESVLRAEAETGHPLLRKSAEENARTWKFAGHQPGTFNVIFRYKLVSDNVQAVLFHPAAVVEIVATPPPEIIEYSEMGLGKWRAELKSHRERSREVFNLFYSGPNGDYLGGRALSPQGEAEEIDFGHIQGDLLAFTVKLGWPDGRRVKIFLVGRLAGAKIIGTFVDDAGTRGEWAAVREQ